MFLLCYITYYYFYFRWNCNGTNTKHICIKNIFKKNYVNNWSYLCNVIASHGYAVKPLVFILIKLYFVPGNELDAIQGSFASTVSTWLMKRSARSLKAECFRTVWSVKRANGRWGGDLSIMENSQDHNAGVNVAVLHL